MGVLKTVYLTGYNLYCALGWFLVLFYVSLYWRIRSLAVDGVTEPVTQCVVATGRAGQPR